MVCDEGIGSGASRHAACSRWLLLGLILVVLMGGRRLYAEEPALPWHLPGWKYRQVVEMVRPDPEGKVNTGLIELDVRPPHVAPDGRDIRVLDEKGRPTRFHLVNEKREPIAPGAQAGPPFMIHFLMEDSSIGYYLVYFGNPDAEATSSIWEKKLGGLVLETRVNTSRRNAANWADMGQIVGMSKWKYGEGIRRQINDTENPFGPNEQFISIYRGLIHCRTDGVYEFGTDSDDSSFLLIDGQVVAAWPGGHNESGRFDHSGKIELKAGIHKIEYYHVQTTGGSLARAGWKPPGAENFVTIPEEAFVRELRTEPFAVESRENPLSAFFKVSVSDSFQFGSTGPTFATVVFKDRSRSSLEPVVHWDWSFGDGTTSREQNPRHVFVGGKTYQVTLRCMDSLGFESVCTKQVAIPSTGQLRIDATLEMAPASALLLPGEPLDVTVKVRTTGGGVLEGALATLYRGQDGTLLDREEEPITLAPGTWLTFERSTRHDGRERIGLGEIACQLEFMGVPVAASRVLLAAAWDQALDLQAAQEQLRDSSGSPVALRLSGDPYRRRRATLRERLRQGGETRILFLDDSLAEPGGSGYPDMVGSSLRAKFPGARVEILRLGEDAAGRPYQPYRALVEYPQRAREIGADAIVVAASLRDVLRFMPVERFERTLHALVDRIEAACGAEVVLIAPPPAIANPGLSQAYAIAVKRVGLRRAISVADAYSAFVRAGERRVPRGASDGSLGWSEFYRDPESDVPIYRISPTTEGQAILASVVERALLED